MPRDGAERWFCGRLFPRWRPDLALRPAPMRRREGGNLRLRWLGAAGFVVETDETTILLDPFVSRPGLVRVAFGHLSPNVDELRRWIPTRVDAVLCGHSHYDHLMDAPAIARASGALLVGSPTTCAFGVRQGVPVQQLMEVGAGGLTLRLATADIRFVPSRHARFGPLGVPFPGQTTPVAPARPRVWDYRMGGAFGIWLRVGGLTLYHNGSADLVDGALDGLRADIVLLGIAGHRSTRDYLHRLLAVLRPQLVIPTHYDAFFAPLARGVHLLPGVELGALAAEIRQVVPRARVVTLDYVDTLAIPSDVREAARYDSRYDEG